MNAFLRGAALAATILGALAASALAADKPIGDKPAADKAAADKAGTTVAATADGKAGGTLTVNGKTTKPAYAYAKAVPGFFDKTKTDVELIVSDVALDAKALSDPYVRAAMAKDGKLHAFEIVINDEGTPISTAWRDGGFKGPTPSGLSTADVFTKKVFDGKTVEGSYKSAAPGEFFDNTYAFDVTFRAVIAH